MKYNAPKQKPHALTVRLLESGSGTTTTELLGFHSSLVGNQQGLVELGVDLLQFVLRGFVDVLLVVSDKALGDGLTDGVDLRDVTTTGHLDSDVNAGELVEADNGEGFKDLVLKHGGLDQGDGGTVDLEETLALLDVGDGGGGLLLAERLDSVGAGHDGVWYVLAAENFVTASRVSVRQTLRHVSIDDSNCMQDGVQLTTPLTVPNEPPPAN